MQSPRALLHTCGVERGEEKFEEKKSATSIAALACTRVLHQGSILGSVIDDAVDHVSHMGASIDFSRYVEFVRD